MILHIVFHGYTLYNLSAYDSVCRKITEMQVKIMGLFGNIIKPLQGKLTAKQEQNMKKVEEVFREKTGKNYQTAVIWKMTTKRKITKTVYTYYNWIIGYGVDENNIPEIVFIPVDPKWDWIEEPIYCKKTDSEMEQARGNKLFTVKNSQLEGGELELQLIISMAMMADYVMDVNYMFDYDKLSEYCQKYWMNK